MDEGQDIVVSALQQLPVPVKKFGARINDIHYNYTKGRETGWNSMKLVCRALGPETGFSEWLFDWLWYCSINPVLSPSHSLKVTHM